MLELVQLLSLTFFQQMSAMSPIIVAFCTFLAQYHFFLKLCLESQMVTEPAHPIVEPRYIFSPDTNLPFSFPSTVTCGLHLSNILCISSNDFYSVVSCPHLGWSYRSSSSPIRFLSMFLNILLLWGLMHSVHRQQYKKRLLNPPKKSQKCLLRDVVSVWD